MVARGTTVELLHRVASEQPDRDAYVQADGSRISFAEWDAAAAGFAGALVDLGVQRGDVVSLILPSSIDYAVCYLAAMRLGAITSGINPRLGAREVASILERTESRVIVVDDDREPVSSSPLLHRRELAALYRRPPPTVVDPAEADTVAIVWTSGTTGVPKGAVFDHRNLQAVAAGVGELGARFDRRFSPNPFSHVGYMTRVYEEIEKVITTVISPTPWHADEALALMARERVTVAQGVPTQWRLMLDHPSFDDTDLSSLRIAGAGAAPVPPELIREIRRRLGCPIVIGYTSTETALATGSHSGDSPEVIARTVGRARVGVEIVVVGDGAVLPSGQIGEVNCRSAAAMRGYWRDPERTAEVLSPDGWVRTGDLGFLDEDANLTLVGRRNEMYLRGSYKVYPVEVERVLAEHFAVAQVAVVGREDPVLGEIGVAFVVPVLGATPTLDDLRGFCRERLADYKAPDILEIVSDLPLTAMAKVDKRALAEVAAGLTRQR